MGQQKISTGIVVFILVVLILAIVVGIYVLYVMLKRRKAAAAKASAQVSRTPSRRSTQRRESGVEFDNITHLPSRRGV
ncbi:hypothetical protein K470DRAFT_259250 [Piedraia hortae CBS 480.64]|uniref:Uncharacterized protein n=1 Tax=Piedraia hortae CBS 480.64 TaxID=1314780 RepID=A0A6A7BV49_9PEZI|nr:hypothetical protein K470DRAFT_259250 [Piedraia hortae CBS 480.64]